MATQFASGDDDKHFLTKSDHYHFHGIFISKIRAWQIGTAIFGVFFILTLIVTSSNSDVTSPQFFTHEECSTAVCIEHANYALEMINSSIEPCQDFYGYACGGFHRMISALEMTDFRGSEDVGDWIQIRNEDKLFQRLLHLQSFFEESAVSKASNLYMWCLDSMRTKYVGENLMDMLRGSRIHFNNSLFELDWDETQWQFNAAFMKLSLEPFAGTLLRFSAPSVNREGSKMNILKISPPFGDSADNDKLPVLPGLGDVGNSPGYRRLIVQVLHHMHQDTGWIYDTIAKINQFADDVVDFNTKLRKMADFDGKSLFSNYTRISLAQLKQKAPQFDWPKILKYLYERNDFDEKAKNYLVPVGYLEHLNNLIETSPKRQLDNMLTWEYMMTILVSFGAKYANALLAYLSTISDFYGHPDSAEYYCRKLVNNVMPLALNYIYYNHHLEANVSKQLEQFNRRQNAVIRDSFSRWMEEEVPSQSSITLAPLYLPWTAQQDKVDDFYQSFFPSGDFFRAESSIATFCIFKLREALRSGNKKQLMMPRSWKAKVYLDTTSMSLQTPLGAMQAPFYSSGLPDYINSAALGSLIIEKLAEGYFWSNSAKNEAWKNAANRIEKFSRYQKCVLGSYDSHSLNTAKNNDYPGIYSMHYALEVAYDHFKSIESNDLVTLPGFEHKSAQQSFFLSFAQARCSVHGEYRDSQQYSMDRSGELDTRTRLNAAFNNNRNFRRVFQCEPVVDKATSASCSILD